MKFWRGADPVADNGTGQYNLAELSEHLTTPNVERCGGGGAILPSSRATVARICDVMRCCVINNHYYNININVVNCDGERCGKRSSSEAAEWSQIGEAGESGGGAEYPNPIDSGEAKVE